MPDPTQQPPRQPPNFDAAFSARLRELILWRRDVRRFRRDPVAPESIDELIGLAVLAPSVGYSQPWRFVLVEDPARRSAVRDSFRRCNREALADYHGARAKLYASLKLSGLDDAPVQLAIFCDEATDLGHGVGRKTMPETLRYSVVTAVHTLWLAARARGLGVGWVSILEPDEIARALEVPDDWALIAYLCIGYPQEEHADPELERGGWEDRLDLSDCVLRR
ncbi:MAG: 5,6-dimethylbenzimidazole synthase [Proteobacteria bacterium]|nr:5,6-dimethylbenzimidazole synthase [Pseudomonadota bacterium]MCH9000235.1 5,6-dimethylbenzimidazole synthase [Pseudomonadota bacterium]